MTKPVFYNSYQEARFTALLEQHPELAGKRVRVQRVVTIEGSWEAVAAQVARSLPVGSPHQRVLARVAPDFDLYVEQGEICAVPWPVRLVAFVPSRNVVGFVGDATAFWGLDALSTMSEVAVRNLFSVLLPPAGPPRKPPAPDIVWLRVQSDGPGLTYEQVKAAVAAFMQGDEEWRSYDEVRGAIVLALMRFGSVYAVTQLATRLDRLRALDRVEVDDSTPQRFRRKAPPLR